MASAARFRRCSSSLLAFGLFGLVQARYRHIDAPDLDDAKAAVARMGR